MSAQSNQGDLFAEKGMSPDDLAGFLNENAPDPVEVTFTRNRVSMVSIDFSSHGDIGVRLHQAFLDAPPDVLRALRTYLRTRRTSAWRTVSAYAHAIPALSGRAAKGRLRTKGRTHDLAEILREVNKRYFNGRVRCRITWGRQAPRKRGRKRSIRFGSYDIGAGVIRVHPSLDSPAVPREFVEFIVFHEILHDVVGPEQRNGQTVYHTETFRRLERSFPKWREMQALSKKLLHKLT